MPPKFAERLKKNVRCYMINWKSVAKYFYQQFRLWVKAYNQIADVYMVGESWSAGSPFYSTIYITIRASDGAVLSARTEIYRWFYQSLPSGPKEKSSRKKFEK